MSAAPAQFIGIEISDTETNIPSWRENVSGLQENNIISLTHGVLALIRMRV